MQHICSLQSFHLRNRLLPPTHLAGAVRHAISCSCGLLSLSQGQHKNLGLLP